MREASRSAKARRDIKTRQHLMERSFAKSTRYGFDRARWRGLWRMRIQEYLTCAIQNIQVMIKHVFKPNKSIAAIALSITTFSRRALSPGLWQLITYFGAIAIVVDNFLKINLMHMRSNW
jgi:hypothetical protein